MLLAKEGTSEELNSMQPQEKSDALEEGMWVILRRWGHTSWKAMTQSRLNAAGKQSLI